jgi:hypothetical protein
MTKPKFNIGKVRETIEEIRRDRETAKSLEASAKEAQSVVIPQMSDVDPDGHGIKITDIDGSEKAAFVQQNEPSEYWDQEALIQWLKDEKLWASCSVRMFDQQRFEALIQTGHIPAKSVQKFRKVGVAPAAFIRFGKPKKESI